MSSRSTVLIVGLVVLVFIGYLVYVVRGEMHTRSQLAGAPSGDSPSVESVRTDLLFESEIRTSHPPVPGISVTTDATDELDETETDDAATTTVAADMVPVEATSTSSLPQVSIRVDGMERTGVRGSYCWEGVCENMLITRVDRPALTVSASSTIPFTVNAAEPPTQVFYFLRPPGSAVAVPRREVTGETIPIDDTVGAQLLFITSVWPDGGEVVHAFHIFIQ